MSTDFSSARNKVARGHQHGNELKASMVYLRSHSRGFDLVTVNGSQREWVEFRMPAHDPDFVEAVEALAVVLGDALHNFRSALDHALTAILAEHDAWSFRDLFPICASSQDFDRHRGMLDGRVPKEILEVIVTVQPFANADVGGWHPLEFLEEVENRDKHHLLQHSHWVLSQASPVIPVPTDVTVAYNEDPLGDDATIVRFERTDGVPIGDVLLDFVFDLAIPTSGGLVKMIEFVDVVEEAVTDVINLLEAAATGIDPEELQTG